MKTRDIDIRTSLNSFIEENFSYDTTTRIIHELNICYGAARVDIAAINGSFHGYEIKSESDTLERLPNQVETYNKVFDYINLVCCERFYDSSQTIIPNWWGIYLAILNSDGSISIDCVREASLNVSVDAFSLCQFLWKNEAIEILNKMGADKNIYRLPKYELWNLISENCPLDELKKYVRTCLKQRNNWRSD